MIEAAAAPIDLPPPYSLVTLRERGDAFAHACRVAPEAGAGTFVLVRRFDLVEFAVVLEPEEPLAAARRVFLPAMVALADAIASHCPPEKPLTIGWPDAVLLDGALLGGGRLGWPMACAEHEIPGWLVFSAMLVVARVGVGEAGLTPASTSLEEEGADTATREAIAESFARHLMRCLDLWQDGGFDHLVQRYLDRLERYGGGERVTIDANGDLMRRVGGRPPERLPLSLALEEPAWLDPATGTVKV